MSDGVLAEIALSLSKLWSRSGYPMKHAPHPLLGLRCGKRGALAAEM